MLKVLSIFSERSLEGILEKSVALIPHVFEWLGVSIFLYDEDENVIRMARTSGLSIDTGEDIVYHPNEGLTGWVFQNKKPLLIRDLTRKTAVDFKKIDPGLTWKGKYSEAKNKKAKSFMAVPLISQNGVFFGVMRTASGDRNFTKSEFEVFSLIARYVSMAIDNSNYISLEQRKSDYLKLLMRVGTQMVSFFELGNLLKYVAVNIAKTISSETCEIYLRHPEDKNRLILRAGYGIPNELINVAEHQVGEGLTGSIVKENRTIRSRNVLLLPEYKGKYRNAIKGHLKFGDRLSFLGMPINLKNETIGAIKLYNKIPGPDKVAQFAEDDEKYLQILVDMLSVAVENVQYLESMKYSAVKTMKNQRLTALGTLSIRIPNEILNPLTEAQLSINNILRKIDKSQMNCDGNIADRLGQIRDNLKRVADGVRVLQEFSTRAGFLHVKRTWQEMLAESLLFLTNDLITKKIDVQRSLAEETKIPHLTVDPNEIIEVLVTLISVTIYRFAFYGSALRIETLIDDQSKLVTNIIGIDNIHGQKIPQKEIDEKYIDAKSYSPYQFSLDVVQEIIKNNYHGSIHYSESEFYSRIILEIPIEG